MSMREKGRKRNKRWEKGGGRVDENKGEGHVTE